MKIGIAIPAYNEAETIGVLVKRIKSLGYEVLVIDDCSNDQTGKIAQDCGAAIIRHDENFGKGKSLQDGFEYFKARDFDAVITMDSDGQHNPEFIPRFAEKAESSDAGLVLGNRMQDPKDMPSLRIGTNRFMSWLISRVTGQRIPDTQCGYRLIKTEVLKNIELTTSNFEIESEVIIKAAKAGFKIESMPITSVYGKEKSRINPFIDTFRFFGMLLRLR